MIRGTTPTLTINVVSNLDLSTIVKLWVTITLDGYEKTFDLDDVEVDATNHKIKIYMSQEETLAFPIGTAELQMRGKTSSNKAFASRIKKVNISKILKEGVI